MSSFEKKHKKGGSKLEGEGGEGEKVIYILSVFSGEKSEIAKKEDESKASLRKICASEAHLAARGVKRKEACTLSLLSSMGVNGIIIRSVFRSS